MIDCCLRRLPDKILHFVRAKGSASFALSFLVFGLGAIIVSLGATYLGCIPLRILETVVFGVRARNGGVDAVKYVPHSFSQSGDFELSFPRASISFSLQLVGGVWLHGVRFLAVVFWL